MQNQQQQPIQMPISKPSKVCISVFLPKGSELQIKGSENGVVYFDRQTGERAEGEVTFEHGLDFNLKNIDLSIAQIKGSQPAIVKKIFVKDISQDKEVITPQRAQFIDFAKAVSQNLDYLPLQSYQSRCGQFRCFVQNEIKDHDGRTIKTPARVNRKNADLYLHKPMLSECTVSMRMFMLLHEYAHFELEQTMPQFAQNEYVVDRLAAEIYCALGLTKLEALYALSKLFLFLDKMPQSHSKYLIFNNFSPNYRNEAETRVHLLKEFLTNK